MTVAYTPWSLIVFLLCAIFIGLSGWLAWKKHYRAAITIFVVFLIVAVLKPVRLAVDDAPIRRSETLTYERHVTIPEKVEAEKKSFNQTLEEIDVRIKQSNQEAQKEILGEPK